MVNLSRVTWLFITAQSPNKSFERDWAKNAAITSIRRYEY